MMRKTPAAIVLLLTALLLTGCRQEKKAADMPESREAKQLLQGTWVGADTEEPVFKIAGDSIYFPDTMSIPSYVKVVGDTLYIGSEARYYIKKQTAHLLWFRNLSGELVKLSKADDSQIGETIGKRAQLLSLTHVLKRDTVVMHHSERYHLYIAVNPTRYKVVRRVMNDDGLDVENVYFDNIIHLSIYKGSHQVFSRDFRKAQYARQIPSSFLDQSVLNNMEYDHTDDEGFHFNSSLCIPDEASCYMVEQTVSFDGKVSSKLLEY